MKKQNIDNIRRGWKWLLKTLYVFEILNIPFINQMVSFIFLKYNHTKSHRMRTKDHSMKFGDIFQESIEQRIKSLKQICFQRQKKFYMEICPARTHVWSSRCVLIIHRPSKHYHVIYGTAKVQTSRKTS